MMMAMSLKASVTKPSVPFAAVITTTDPDVENRVPETCPLKEKSLMRVAEHALVEVGMPFAHQEKLNSKGRSSPIQSCVKCKNAVAVARGNTIEWARPYEHK